MVLKKQTTSGVFWFFCIKLMVNFFPKLLQFNLFDKDGITFYD